jgi:hypothetical protein
MKIILASLLATAYATSLHERKLATSDFFSSDGHLYKAVLFPGKTWQEAADDAALLKDDYGKKAHLATITSEDEGAVIEDLRKAAQQEGLTQFWVGGVEVKQPEDTWKWVTGEDFDYQNWAVGEPSGDGPYLTVGRFADNGDADGKLWNDLQGDCSDVDIVGYIAEIDEFMVIDDLDIANTLIINGCDTGVVDIITVPDGECTRISSIIEACDDYCTCEPYTSCVAKRLNPLVKARNITGRDKGAIQRCAAKKSL